MPDRVEWVPSASLTGEELPLAGDRLDPARLGTLEGGSTGPELHVRGKAGAAEPREDAAPRPSTVLLDNRALSHSQPDTQAHQRFAGRTRGGADMAHYRTLLERPVAAVSGKAEEKGVESLFHRGGTAMSCDSHRGLDDFEVVAYLAVL